MREIDRATDKHLDLHLIVDNYAAHKAARQVYYRLGFRPFGFEAGALRIGDRYDDEEHISVAVRTL